MSRERATKAGTGKRVRYCGHNAWFVADVFEVEGACVVRAPEPINLQTISRADEEALSIICDYHMIDGPGRCFWRPELGVFVVPSKQLRPVQITRFPGAK